MAFNTLSVTIGGVTRTFNSTGGGQYMLSTVGLSDPKNGFKLTPGRKSSAASPISATVTRFVEKAITVNGTTSVKKMSVTIQYSVPDGFTAAEVDAALEDISVWSDSSNVTRLLLGES